MKIQPPVRPVTGSSESPAGTDRATGKPQASSGPSPGVDRVDLSPLSAQIAALESSLAADPAFDAKRVEAIKQAIVDGRLSVSADTVADRMIASALAMFDRRA